MQIIWDILTAPKKVGRTSSLLPKEWPGGGTEVFEIGQNAPKELKNYFKEINHSSICNKRESTAG